MEKFGVLRRTTFIHCLDNITIKFRKGTEVYVSNGVLRFNPVEGVTVTKLSGRYFLNLFGSIHLIIFPKGGRVPYPLSML